MRPPTRSRSAAGGRCRTTSSRSTTSRLSSRSVRSPPRLLLCSCRALGARAAAARARLLRRRASAGRDERAGRIQPPPSARSTAGSPRGATGSTARSGATPTSPSSGAGTPSRMHASGRTSSSTAASDRSTTSRGRCPAACPRRVTVDRDGVFAARARRSARYVLTTRRHAGGTAVARDPARMALYRVEGRCASPTRVTGIYRRHLVRARASPTRASAARGGTLAVDAAQRPEPLHACRRR